MTILQVRNVSKQYAGHVALRDVSLEVPLQSVYGLLGPNGAGKTTLLRIINQIIGADSGSVLFRGEPIRRAHVDSIGYLPEERGLYRKMKVGDHLLYLARLKGLSSGDAKRELKFWQERLDISGWLNKKVEELSKGMQQMVQFIATVVHKPELLILDEPFTGFDPINAEILKGELKRLRESGATIILSTHRMESVEELCTHMTLINKSRKVVEGPISSIRESHRSNTYTITYTGRLPEQFRPSAFVVTESTIVEEGASRSTVKLNNGGSPNAILGELLPLVEIHHFDEQIPSIHDIFISLVKDGAQ